MLLLLPEQPNDMSATKQLCTGSLVPALALLAVLLAVGCNRKQSNSGKLEADVKSLSEQNERLRQRLAKLE